MNLKSNLRDQLVDLDPARRLAAADRALDALANEGNMVGSVAAVRAKALREELAEDVNVPGEVQPLAKD
jgi:uncharacterized protein (UPF0147 family)